MKLTNNVNTVVVESNGGIDLPIIVTTDSVREVPVNNEGVVTVSGVLKAYGFEGSSEELEKYFDSRDAYGNLGVYKELVNAVTDYMIENLDNPLDGLEIMTPYNYVITDNGSIMDIKYEQIMGEKEVDKIKALWVVYPTLDEFILGVMDKTLDKYENDVIPVI